MTGMSAGVDTDGITGREVPTVWDVFAAIVSTNPVAAFASGEMLQIIFYTIILGVAVLMFGHRSKGFVEDCEYMNEVMMKVATIVAKGEGKVDMSIFNDPNAGQIAEEDMHIDEAVEAELAEVAHKH